MSPQKAFSVYYGVHLHFTQKEYSVLKYGTNTKASITKFESMPSGNKFRFDWLSSKYIDSQDLIYACIGAEFSNVSLQFDSKEDVTDAYFKFKRRREAMTYSLKQDISKYNDLEHKSFDKVIFKYFVDELSPELMLLLTHDTEKLEELYELPNFSWAKPKILKLIKYNSFFNTTKYIHLLTEQQ